MTLSFIAKISLLLYEIPNTMAKLNTADIGFEDQIWKAADKMRGNLDASEYKSVVLGLIFLKYISDKSLRHDIMNFWQKGRASKKIRMNILIRMCSMCQQMPVGQ